MSGKCPPCPAEEWHRWMGCTGYCAEKTLWPVMGPPRMMRSFSSRLMLWCSQNVGNGGADPGGHQGAVALFVNKGDRFFKGQLFVRKGPADGGHRLGGEKAHPQILKAFVVGDFLAQNFLDDEPGQARGVGRRPWPLRSPRFHRNPAKRPGLWPERYFRRR